MFDGQVVLITGGTGSFGSAMAKHLLKNYRLKKLIIFSRDWLKQLQLKDELGDPEICRWFIGDVRSYERLEMAFQNVDYCIHSAAIKDLNACQENIMEAVQTNTIGTQNVAMACIKNNVKMAILISTDKAEFSTTPYGKTKALAEDIWINSSVYSAGRTKFSVCRYGNIWGSSGSILPRFKQMIANGIKELPLTDERMTRYFFTMNGAISLVIDSFNKMKGGETFIPDLPSFRIVDLIKAFDMPYKIVGIRENEKLAESLGGKSSEDNKHFLTVEELREYINSNV